MKILAVGDIHLGRRPSRLPPELAERAGHFGPDAAWERTVDAALRLRVRAVLLAGDVVDTDDDFFEAYRALESGVGQLADAGIEVVGVAGNHDVQVLPRLAQSILQFKLLGKDGQWESIAIREGDESLAVWGWSFPQKEVKQSPLADAGLARQSGLSLGLLHCDRDAGESKYAPVTGAELARAGLDGWLLGHIHQPDALSATRPSGYLGSLSGLHRGETGIRGPWLIDIERGAIRELRQLALAPLRWERREVDIEGIAEATDAKSRVIASLREFDATLSDAEQAPRAVGLDLRFTGRSRFGAEAVKEFSDDDRRHIYTGADNRHYFIHALSAQTRPEIELQELARRDDPLGLLAQRLLWLEKDEGHPQRDRLLAAARKKLAAEDQDPRWSALQRIDADDDFCGQRLREAGYRALDELLAQDAERGAA